MSKKEMKKRIKKLESRVSKLKKDLALFSARSEATASRTAFYELELEKVKDLLLEAKGKFKSGCSFSQSDEAHHTKSL